jgi:hypothetical protein
VPCLPAMTLMYVFAATARPAELAALLVVVVVAVLCAIVMLVLLRGLLAARGTTLFAPLAWALVSLGVLLAASTSLRTQRFSGVANFEKWWLVAATSTFCPLIALLGAKRPQNRAWQMIVLSFWGIIALPAIQSLILHPSEALDLHFLWQSFFIVLILMGWLNYVSSAFGLVGFCVALGQTFLFWHWLPFIGTYPFWWPELGVVFICLAVMFGAGVASARRRLLESAGVAAGWSRVWIDFHDWYGLLWSRRVMQRVEEQTNASIEWIDWYALRASAAQEPAGANEEHRNDDDAIAPVGSWAVAEPALRSMLRRFVSNEWIERRLNANFVAEVSETE